MVLGVLGLFAALITLKLLWPSIDDMDVVMAGHPASLAAAVSTDLRMETLEADVAAGVATARALEVQVRNQAAALDELKAALAAVSERQAQAAQAPPRRGRKSVPDPPASSYLKLQ
jgi:uncharacterized coiled-coil protein SlyX